MEGRDAIFQKRERMTKNLVQKLLNCNSLIICDTSQSQPRLEQQLRKLFGDTVSLMATNNGVMRKALREVGKTQPQVTQIIPLITGQVGLMLLTGEVDPFQVMEVVHAITIPTFGVAGQTLLSNVVIRATTTDPSSTSFFQALGLRADQDFNFMRAGETLGVSEANFLRRINHHVVERRISFIALFLEGQVFHLEELPILDPTTIGRRGLRNATLISRELRMG
eukprot:TRINITY_DN9787_c0_g1_i2.p1 TRINITY_DN9787_c0_g1~~TRINITY_DN9787_c0_g1_i2.p1  ORF type:complete len:223 (-),score=17.70 TRINITY_DN9787_c0_g1_i2:111-779(-)